MLKVVRVILILFVLAPPLQAQTTISTGVVSGTWSLSGSPYHVKGDVNVPANSTLAIEAGVEVRFDPGVNLTVYGIISALGSDEKPIQFSATDTTKGWEGIWLRKNTNRTDSILFENCMFRNAITAANGGCAMAVESVSRLRFSYCEFSDNRVGNGAALVARYSDFRMDHCLFRNNTCSGSLAAIFCTTFCHVLASDCEFRNNICYNANAADIPEYELPGIACISSSSGKFSRMNFYGNHSSAFSGLAMVVGDSDDLRFDGMRFESNVSNENSCLFVSTPDKKISHVRVSFNNVYMRNNTLQTPKGNVSGYASTNTAWGIRINGMTLINQDGEAAMSVHHEIIDKLVVMGSDSIGVLARASEFGDSIVISNALVVNNGYGIFAHRGSKILLVSSTVAYNGCKNTALTGGLRTEEYQSAFGLCNDIIQHNYSAGKLSNWVSHAGCRKLTCLRGTLLQGGMDSVQDLLHNGTKFQANWTEKWYSDTVQFVNPPKGFGAAFYDTAADFHVRNTCTYSSETWNGGVNDPGDGFQSLSYNNAKDLDGNTRIMSGIVDPGAYEMQGPNAYTKISREPADTMFCDGAGIVSAFVPVVAGNDLSYLWQQAASAAGPFSDVSTGTPALVLSIGKGNTGAWYRLIAKNGSCNTADTSKVVKMTVNALPQPQLGNDTGIQNAAFLLLNPGKFSSYRWFNNSTASTLKVDKTNLQPGPNQVWVEVSNAFGCKNRDSMQVALQWPDGLVSPSKAGISVFPVPMQEQLWLSLPPTQNGTVRYELSNLQGQIMLQGSFSGATVLNVSALPAGTYVLRLEEDGKVYGMKVVK